MADKATKNNENMVEVTAKINLKYDNDIKKAGEKLQIRESDLESMKKRDYINYTPPTEPKQSAN